MRKLTFTNSRGESVILGNSAPFLVTKLDGAIRASIQTQKSPFQDGATYINSFLEPRQLSLEGAILKNSGEEIFMCRRKLASVFNPKLGLGKLLFEYDGGKKEILAVADGAPAFPDRSGQPSQKFLITLFCPNPLWTDDGVADQLVVFEGGLTFPLSLPTRFSNQSASRSKVVLNKGDVETPLEITFLGPAQSPIRIQNETTGEFIEVNQSLLDGERLRICTEFGKKRVMKIDPVGNETNAFHYISLDSTFFQLIPGNNLLSYRTGNEYERTPVQIVWRNRYLGV